MTQQPPRDVEGDIRAVVAECGGTCLVLSPHLDDAVLSCGDLLAGLTSVTGSTGLTGLTADEGASSPVRVVVLSVFTDSGPPPWPWMARRIARASGFADSRALFQARRAEDRAALAGIGVEVVHLGHPEAPYRRCRRRWGPTAVYPTFRFDALRGRRSRFDRPLSDQLARQFADVVDELRACVVLAPLGVGAHVDHLIVRDAAVRALSGHSARLIHYGDFPYVCDRPVDEGYVRRRGLVRHLSRARQAGAYSLMGRYHTQMAVLFPQGKVPQRDEEYWSSR